MEAYLYIKHAHWLFILLSIILFNLKFWVRTAKPQKPLHWAWRVVPPLNDTFLLFSGMIMMTLAKWSPFGSAPWLGIKLLLLIAYIVLGIISMRAPARSVKSFSCYAAAMVCVAVMAWLGHCKLMSTCQFFANWV